MLNSNNGSVLVIAETIELEPLVAGWQRVFSITWRAGERRGRPIVSGKVENKHGDAAARVQLLVDGIDADGTVINQKVTWLSDDIPPFDSRYFEVPVKEAPSYRVSVFSYGWIEAHPSQR